MLHAIDRALTLWADVGTDPVRRREQVNDLEEALHRHITLGNPEDYQFFDPGMEAGPAQLTPEQVGQIAAVAARVLLDPSETTSMRISTAFLLGKTRHAAAMKALVELLTTEPSIPWDLVRQCAFSFDSLQFIDDAGAIARDIDLDQVGNSFEQYGIPWDRVRRRVDSDSL